MSQNVILGPPSKSRGRPNSHQKSAKRPKNINGIISRHGLCEILKPTRFQQVARRATGFIFNDLLWILGPFRIFYMAEGTNSAKPSSTKLYSKYPQRPCKELRKTCKNELTSKLSRAFCNFRNNISRNKPRTIKSGGGGVRAAWRIRISI